MRYDAIVLGLGAFGSATIYQLAKRGARVLGIDQLAPPHDQGSTHGDTRITRLANGENPLFTGFVRRSHEIWREIERETGENLLTQCGGLIISGASKASIHVEGFFENTVANARANNVAHERLRASDIRARFPQFNVRDDESGYFEPEMGFVRPEACVRAQLGLAQARGAELRLGERLLGFRESDGGVEVRTDRGTYRADTAILALGAWLPEICPQLAPLLKIHRQTLFWFDIDGEEASYEPGRFPIFIWELPDRTDGIYGFPVIEKGGGLKVATEQYAQATTPQAVRRDVPPQEIAAMHRLIAPFLPRVSARCLKAVTCLYTVTPDGQFIIDRLPGAGRVIVASPCSGHGFKHSPAIGEGLADMALEGRSRLDLTPFRLVRFG
ncbi:MAG TPA: N-methyl-L-tryptophan oxidase [Rhizomicrobium sp.]|nr:N-methyl-L-tryptophan oxidase [Rhizomicrobium sp.]